MLLIDNNEYRELFFSVFIVDKHYQTIGQKIEQPKRPRFKGEAGT